MAKRPTTTPEQEGIEFRPDGWDRFKAAVHAAAKTSPPKTKSKTESLRSRKPPKSSRG